MKNSTNLPDSQGNPAFKELISILGNGFILSLFTIDFFCFEYVLPILGSLIMLYGCRLVKDHNKYFKRMYHLAYIRFLTMLANFTMDWTKFHDNNILTYLQITVAAVLIIGIFINMDLAFREIYRQANVPYHSNRLRQYIVLYLCTIASTYLTIHLGILGAMLSLFILILNIVFLLLTFYQLGDSLSKLNTELTLTHVTTSEKRNTAILLGCYSLVLILTVLFSNKALFLPTRSSTGQSQMESNLNTIEQSLLNLGVDKDILADLPKSDIPYLKDASSITSDTSIKEINNGSLKIRIFDITCPTNHRVIVHYEWLTPPDNRLYQIIECQYPKASAATNITSKSYVLKQKECETLELPNINLGLNDASYPYVQHKLSNVGTNLRGYLAFSYVPSEKANGKSTKYTINYYYQASVFNLPYLNIIDYMNDYNDHTSSMVFNRVAMNFTLKP